MSEIDLKPCPRCGSESSFGLVRYGKTKKPHAWFADGTPVEIAHYVNCPCCSLASRTIVGGFQTQELAAQHWNTRPAIERAIAEAVAAEREKNLTAVESARIATDGWGDPIDDGDCERNEGIDLALAAIRSAAK